MSPDVAAAFKALPADAQAGLVRLRALIYDCAAGLPETGGLREELRWGQPAYLPAKPKVGTTLRLGAPKTGGFALYVHCGTSVIPDHVRAFPGLDTIEGKRAVRFTAPDQIDPVRHGHLICHALTYHLMPKS